MSQANQLPEGDWQSLNARLGAYVSKDGFAIPLQYQPFSFMSMNALLARSNANSSETDSNESETRYLTQAKLFYGSAPYFYSEVRVGTFIDKNSYPFYGAKLALGGDKLTFGVDYEEGQVDEEFDYEKWQLLWLRPYDNGATMVTQIHRSEYLNEAMSSELSSIELAFGWRVNTWLFSLLPVPIDLDFIFHAPSYNKLKFKDQKYTLASSDWRFVFGLSQAF